MIETGESTKDGNKPLQPHGDLTLSKYCSNIVAGRAGATPAGELFSIQIESLQLVGPAVDPESVFNTSNSSHYPRHTQTILCN